MLRPYRLKILLLVSMAGFAFSLSSVAQDPPQDSAECPKPSSWSYPSTSWAKDFPKCCSQTNPETKDIQQSPIDIASSTEKTLTLALNYNGADVPVEALDHTVEVVYHELSTAKQSRASEGQPTAVENYVTYNGKKHWLLQFHFHLPNEHEIKGKPVAKDMENMEVHLVHQATDGGLLVVGVLINKGAANEAFGKILANVGGHANLNPVDMIPGAYNTSRLKFYTYTGSLTTPPCTPPVTWVVLKDPITISSNQLTSYEKLDNGKYEGTSRYPQPAITTLTVDSNFKP
jgi:carbonic anhydrase